MTRAKTLLRSAALVSSFGLIGTYVACQQNGGRLPGTTMTDRVAQTQPAEGGNDGTDLRPRKLSPILAGSKSSSTFDLGPASPVGQVPPPPPSTRRMLLPGSKSDSSTFVQSITGTPGPLGSAEAPAAEPATAPVGPHR